MSLEPDRTEVVAGREVDVSVECRSKSAQGNGGLGAGLLDALDLVPGQARAMDQLGDGEAQGGSGVIDGVAEGQRLTDRDPLRVLGQFLRARPAGMVAGYPTFLS